jgi:hypothetical protein
MAVGARDNDCARNPLAARQSLTLHPLAAEPSPKREKEAKGPTLLDGCESFKAKLRGGSAFEPSVVHNLASCLPAQSVTKS